MGHSQAQEKQLSTKRSSLFSSRNITVAQRWVANPVNNSSLSAAVTRAHMVSMPNAIQALSIRHLALALMLPFTRGSFTRGYGLRVSTVYVDCLTSNRTDRSRRSFAFTHSGGNLGTAGSVAFQFESAKGHRS